MKARKTETSDRLAKLTLAIGGFAMDVLKDASSSLPDRNDVRVDIEDFNYSAGRLKLSGRTTSFEAVDKIKIALEKSGKFKSVTTGNVRKGVKDDIKFDISMETGR